MPLIVEEAYAINRKISNAFWRDSVEKEMNNIRIAFKILEDKEYLLRDYKLVSSYSMFNIKIDFTRKAR